MTPLDRVVGDRHLGGLECHCFEGSRGDVASLLGRRESSGTPP